jgi:DNA helicase-2/ATP-dependent DNA helicase PcrA
VEDILSHLNEAQRLPVECTEGPMMVIAGPGSGKTRVLTYKVAYLISIGIDPFTILALTFTNKAAREMKDRILKLVDNRDAPNVWMGTFHSIFARILRIEGHRLGYPSNYSIYDTDDSKSLIKSIINEQDLDNKIYAPGYVLYRISDAKTNLLTADAYNQNVELMTQDKMSGKPRIGLLYSLYQGRLFKASAMDFDDLLMNFYRLLNEQPEMLYKYQRKFQYILVDEYQDTNRAQYMILKKLAANNENICVVGDDAQSIYAFRGANIQNILNFRHDYPDLKVFKLEQNYRSTQIIVNAANNIIVNNKDQITKKIWTQNGTGNKISLLKAITDSEEGTLVAHAIFENKMNHQLKNSAFAVLYRTNAQSRSFEESLRKLNIPYRIYGGLSFYKRKEIKDLLAYFRLVINNRDEEAMMRIINYPSRGIGKTSLEKLIVIADKQKKTVWEVMETLPDRSIDINSGTQNKMAQFATMIKSFSVQLGKKDAYILGKEIASASGILKELYEDRTAEGVNRFENIEELLNAIKDFTVKITATGEEAEAGAGTLGHFMQDVALLTDADTSDKDNPDHVSLMTVHAAKGLEFPYVFVVGLEENLFPSIQSLNSRTDLEEERRLFYVAVTRAQEKVTLSYAENRYRWGTLTISEPSRFIDEIDVEYLEIPKRASLYGNGFTGMSTPQTPDEPGFASLRRMNLKKIPNLDKSTAKSDFESSDLDQLQPGMEVEHERFGSGKVIAVEGAGPNKKATIFFRDVGQKQLLLRFAKLKIV